MVAVPIVRFEDPVTMPAGEGFSLGFHGANMNPKIRLSRQGNEKTKVGSLARTATAAGPNVTRSATPSTSSCASPASPSTTPCARSPTRSRIATAGRPRQAMMPVQPRANATPQNISRYDASGVRTCLRTKCPETPRPVTTLRPERDYSATEYDEIVDGIAKTLRRQCEQKYDVKSVRNREASLAGWRGAAISRGSDNRHVLATGIHRSDVEDMRSQSHCPQPGGVRLAGERQGRCPVYVLMPFVRKV